MTNVSLDFKKAYSAANELLVSSKSIITFPFSPKKLIREKSDIACRSYKKGLEYGVDIHDFGSDSATIFKYHGKKIIFFDETKPEPHIKYSILHEYGHDYLGHDLDKKDEETYGKYEIETNFFSAQLLMPEQILHECTKRGVVINNQFLRTHFGVSKEAAEKRLNTLAKTNFEWRSRQETEYDDIILAKFSSFVDSICPKSSYYDYDYEENLQRQRDKWF